MLFSVWTGVDNTQTRVNLQHEDFISNRVSQTAEDHAKGKLPGSDPLKDFVLKKVKRLNAVWVCCSNILHLYHQVSKPVMEKRRRERINHSLETLRLLMLENTHNEVRMRVMVWL